MDHRTEPRFQPDQNRDVTVKIVGSESSPAIEALLLNVSRSGMGLRTKAPLDVGANIEVDLTNMIAYGVVIRCLPQDDVYLIAVQITETAGVPKTLTATNQRRQV